MGEIIAKKIRGMNWMAKVSLVMIFTMVVIYSVVQAVNIVDNWDFNTAATGWTYTQTTATCNGAWNATGNPNGCYQFQNPTANTTSAGYIRRTFTTPGTSGQVVVRGRLQLITDRAAAGITYAGMSVYNSANTTLVGTLVANTDATTAWATTAWGSNLTLNAGTTYTIRVNSQVQCGGTANRYVRTDNIELITSPANLASTGQTNNSVSLSWAATTIGSGTQARYGYNVYYATVSGGPYTKHNVSIIPSGTTTYDVTGLNPGTTYYFVVTDVTVGADGTGGNADDIESPNSIQLTQATSSGTVPTVTSTSPNNRAQGVVGENIIINGSNFVSGASLAATFGAGITVNSVTFNSATQITANIDIAPAATPGARNVTVTNGDGGGPTTLTNGFTVNAAPTVTSASPNSMLQGTGPTTVTITGTGFQTGATVTISGGGITLGSVTVVNATTITVPVTVDAGATPGLRSVSVLNTDGGTGSGSVFTVTAVPPTVTSATPNSLPQGSVNTDVAIAGTYFASGATVSFSGTGITVNGTTWESATLLTANITIAAGATIGLRNVTVTNPDLQTGTGTGIFTVTAGSCSRIAPTVSLGSNQTIGKSASAIYSLTITNNDNVFCSNSTFSIAKTDTPSVPTADFSASTLSSASTGSLAPGATYNTATLTHTTTAGATDGQTLQSTVNVTDGTNHAAQPGSASVTTTVAAWSNSNLLHNSTNLGSTAWGTSGWGIPGGKYGAFTCATCHTRSTTNIKRIKTAITSPDNSNWPNSSSTTGTVAFTQADPAGNASDMGDTSATGGWTGICNVCHDATKHNHYSYNSSDGHNGGSDCAKCHMHNNAFKGEGECLTCHNSAQGSRAPVVGQFSANSHHVQGVTLTNAHCYNCHWEANADGSMNSTYHLTSPGGVVDLVVWNTIARPPVYNTTSGSGRTAVQLVSSGIGSRTEVAKVTNHCLGCHSDANFDTQPFGDGKRTSQYAWDSTSVAARYTQLGTTNWGKFSPWFTRAAEKNASKAFSAHGNAGANQMGWNTTTGVDETIENRTSNVNVECFDCHNSHGSNVAGRTVSYTTTGGGLLKQITSGQGGYAVTYAPAAGTTGTVNYNAGASLCFECHNKQDASATPWGWGSTYGASAPIMGYFEKPYWWGTRSAPTGARSGPQMRYAYKNNKGTAGTHFGASSPLTSAAANQINGICTPCHDPHGVSPTFGTNQQYAVPLLKGTYVTSPYQEDAAPLSVTEGRGGSRRSGEPTPYTSSSTPGYHIDQNTFGPVQTGLMTTNDWEWMYTTGTLRIGTTAVNLDDTKFAGLCLKCHSKTSLNPLSSGGAAWKSKQRIHATVKGWGNNSQHEYTCSKCHTPHSSCLPRLTISNCLDFEHRGRVAQGGRGIWGSQTGSSGAGQGRFPAGGGGSNNRGIGSFLTIGAGGGSGPWFFGTGAQTSSATKPVLTTCHNPLPLNSSGGVNAWMTMQWWNAVTPWKSY